MYDFRYLLTRADICIGKPIEVKRFSPEDVNVLSTKSTGIVSLSSSAIFCVGEGDHFYIPGAYYYSVANNGNRDALLFFSVVEGS
mmetsp:Transcript_32149/g.46720  ORF Transcript_32149/g.46720 Transcript_32149/m.46720 type:complete len:85 (-) Transcript_32149:426-680(-)